MQLPTQLSRRKKYSHKNDYGHILVLAGSKTMLGAGALTCLAALRSGAGLVTFGIPKSLNLTAQKKISNEIMTLPLEETKDQAISIKAYAKIKSDLNKYNVIAIGPGIGKNKSTKSFIYKIIENSKLPLVVDADALNALSENINILKKVKAPIVLTPHPGEFSRLSKLSKKTIQSDRKKCASEFSKKFNCTLLLKGNKTIASSQNKIYINNTGNPGMATAGSGDVLTDIIAAFIGQGLSPFDAAKYGTFIHGFAGDIASKKTSQISLIASDIIKYLPAALRKLKIENRR